MQVFIPIIGSIRIKKYKDTFVSAKVIFAYIIFIITQTVILKSFIFYSDEIKKDEKLINAYEDILLALTEIRNEKAAVLLDEFRIH